MFARGNAATTTSRMSPAEGLKAVTLYAVRVSAWRGAAASASNASMPSGIAMNGIVVSGRTKQSYGSCCAAA